MLVSLGLLALALISYGPLIPWLGFYWDDWPMLWFRRVLGAGGYGAVFAIDRPGLALWFPLTTSLLGESPLSWQVFALLAHWVASVAAWWAVVSIWPGRRRLAVMAAALFLVYPGFSQQSISVIYSHYWLIYAVFLASLALSARAARAGKAGNRLTLAALLLTALSHFSLEYFAGLELLRPLVIAAALRQAGDPEPGRRRRAVRRWLPYLSILIAYAVWRVGWVGYGLYRPEGLQQVFQQPLSALPRLLGTAVVDVVEGGLVAWLKTFAVPLPAELGRLASAGSLLVSLVAALAALGLFWDLRRRQGAEKRAAVHKGGGADAQNERAGVGSDPQDERTRAQTKASAIGAGGLARPLAFGLAAVAVAGLPFWIANLPLQLEFPWDRLTLPMAFGSSVLVAGLLSRLARRSGIWLGACALLVGLAAGTQFRYANDYRNSWERLQAFVQQLALRIPDLEPGTTLMANNILSHDYYSDNSLSAILNWVYAPDQTGPEMTYLFSYLSVRVGRSIPDLEPGTSIELPYRAAEFHGSNSEALVVFHQPPGCVRVLDLVLDDSLHVLPEELSAAVHLSDLRRIRIGAEPGSVLPRSLFGDPPADSWCTAYEQADLARQRGDWEQVARIAERALALDDRPNEVTELLPYIEAYAYLGEFERAVQLTVEGYQTQPPAVLSFCNLWDRLRGELPADLELDESAERAEAALACPSD